MDQTKMETHLEELVNAVMQQSKIPGLSLVVVKDGCLVSARGFGLANRERGILATEQTVYPLASVTKTFTATAIMLLVEDGKISLDRPVVEWLSGLPESWAGITIRHLLSHTSGIKDCYADAGFWYQDAATAWDRIQAVARLPLAFPPGTQWKYSNTGYLLLGEVVLRISGQPYHEFLAARVFRPLGMSKTKVHDPRNAEEDWAIGYRRKINWWRLRTEPVPVEPQHPLIAGSSDGGLVSTAVDLATWDIALGRGRVVREESLKEMWTPWKPADIREPGYGLGWVVDLYDGRRIVGHNGGDPGFATCFLRFIDDDVSVALLANRGGNLFLNIHAAIWNLTGKIAKEYLAQPTRHT